jgi:hypothetical protein
MSRAARCLLLPLALLAAAAPGGARAAPGLVPIPLETIAVDEGTPHLLAQGGLHIANEATCRIDLPVRGAQVVELDVENSGELLLTWSAQTPGREFTPFGPPWRHLTIPHGRSTLTLDFRIVPGWTVQSAPVLGVTGSGRLLIRQVRALGPDRDRDRQLDAFDRANLWAPEALGPTTINLLTPSFWKMSRGRWLADVVAAVAALAFAAVLAWTWRRRRRPRPALALAVAAVVAAGLWDAHLLVRLVPPFDLRPTPDPERRIRDNFWVAPDLGAVTAIARATLRPGERVGVATQERDWFSAQTLCFNLAPRPCVVLHQNEPVHHGISQVGALRDEELDAVIVFRAGWAPAGFERIAGVGPLRWIGRRR